MGQRIDVPTPRDPAWAEVAARLTSAGQPATIRMIDGLPAFPDETPDDSWTELRLSLPGGMVTLRRDAGVIACTVWGNADAALLASQQACADAIASAAADPAPAPIRIALPSVPE